MFLVNVQQLILHICSLFICLLGDSAFSYLSFFSYTTFSFYFLLLSPLNFWFYFSLIAFLLLIPFFPRLGSGPSMISLCVNWRQSFSWYKLPQRSFLWKVRLLKGKIGFVLAQTRTFRILCSLFLRSQLFKFLRIVKVFFTEVCSATSQENVICCHWWIHWKSSISCSQGMPHTS